MNKKYTLWGLGSVLIVLVGLFCFSQRSSVELVILHTNDHHGYCWSIENKGGLAKQYTVVQQVRQKNKNVLLLSAGDINTGYPESDVNQAEPSFKGMRLMGFDAIAVGNHEFDVSLSLLRQQQIWGGFPFLSANIYKKNSQQRLFTPYIIKKLDSLRIAIVGLTTEETAYIAKFIEDIEFRDPIEEMKRLMPALKQQADLIIALTHMGYDADPSHGGLGTTDLQLAEANPQINVIVGGHSHTLLSEPVRVGQTLILQAYQYAKNMGELHLTINRLKKKIVKIAYQMHDIDEKIPESKEILTLLNPYLARAKVLFDQKVGRTNVYLDGKREHVRSQETNLGNLITDLFRKMTKAEVAIQNGGGIRAPIAKGIISFRDIRKSFPFDNTIVVLTLSGRELLEILNRSASLTRPAGGFLQVSGVSFEIHKDHVRNVRINKKPLILDRVYSVATNDFIAKGGDGYALFKGKSYSDTGFAISGALKNYISLRKTISPKVEGRIIIR